MIGNRNSSTWLDAPPLILACFIAWIHSFFRSALHPLLQVFRSKFLLSFVVLFFRLNTELEGPYWSPWLVLSLRRWREFTLDVLSRGTYDERFFWIFRPINLIIVTFRGGQRYPEAKSKKYPFRTQRFGESYLLGRNVAMSWVSFLRVWLIRGH